MTPVLSRLFRNSCVCLVMLAGMSAAARADDEEGSSTSRRWYLDVIAGKTLTSAILGTDLGNTIRGSYSVPEMGFGIGFQQDFDTHLALDVRASYLGRTISYETATSPQSVSAKFVHAPIQIRVIPKRWVHFGTGPYLDYCFRGGFPTEFGWTLLGGFDLPMTGRPAGKFGLSLDVSYDMSFLSFSDVAARQLYIIFGLRFGGNSTPPVD